MFMLCAFLVLCSLAGILVGQENVCRHVKPLQDFNISKYMGTWYSCAWVNFEAVKKCFKYTWFVSPDGEIRIDMHESFKDKRSMFYDSAKVRVPDASRAGYFEIIHDGIFGVRGKYTILETDYTSYSVEYSCQRENSELRVVSRELYLNQSGSHKAWGGYLEAHGNEVIYECSELLEFESTIE